MWRSDRRRKGFQGEVGAFGPGLNQGDRGVELFSVWTHVFLHRAGKYQARRDWFQGFDVEQHFKTIFDGWSHERVQRRLLVDAVGADRDHGGGVAEADTSIGRAAVQSRLE